LRTSPQDVLVDSAAEALLEVLEREIDVDGVTEAYAARAATIHAVSMSSWCGWCTVPTGRTRDRGGGPVCLQAIVPIIVHD
jgi:hypothetical protein